MKRALFIIIIFLGVAISGVVSSAQEELILSRGTHSDAHIRDVSYINPAPESSEIIERRRVEENSRDMFRCRPAAVSDPALSTPAARRISAVLYSE